MSVATVPVTEPAKPLLPRERQVHQLVFVEKKTVEDAAEALGVRVAAVLCYASGVRKKLGLPGQAAGAALPRRTQRAPMRKVRETIEDLVEHDEARAAAEVSANQRCERCWLLGHDAEHCDLRQRLYLRTFVEPNDVGGNYHTRAGAHR